MIFLLPGPPGAGQGVGHLNSITFIHLSGLFISSDRKSEMERYRGPGVE